MSPDDTTPPEMTKTIADPGPMESPLERCIYIRVPLRIDLSEEATSDPDHMAGLCAMLEMAAKDAVKTSKGDEVFDVERVKVAYDSGEGDPVERMVTVAQHLGAL